MMSNRRMYIIYWLSLATGYWLCLKALGGRIDGAAVCVDGEFQCLDGSCINASLVCDWVSNCVGDEDESVTLCGCLPHEFQCDSAICIDLTKRCDTVRDCADGKDEENCHLFVCPPSRFKCSNDYCISRQLSCDFHDDCGDGSDETQCTYRTCYPSEYRCNNSECIPELRLCDGSDDCDDGSDETNCDNHVLCDNHVYISASKKCDGWSDCVQGHNDELQCGPCTAKEFQCNNGRCISKGNLCDGVCDCAYSCEDENDCDDHSWMCPKGDFYLCRKKMSVFADRCIDKQYLCDGRNDCRNTDIGGDEFFCREDCSSVGSPGRFRCPEGRCLHENSLCDYSNDCLNGEDERLDSCVFRECNRTEFRCENSQCVPLSRRCDTAYDCWDRTDEVNCVQPETCDGFLCRSGHCVTSQSRCNFVRDCPDNSDENQCNETTCGHDEHRCKNGQCIPIEERCLLSERGCIDGSHLHDCVDEKCSLGYHKCDRSYCIDARRLCDGVIDCNVAQDDERMQGCSFRCPFPGEEICQCDDSDMDCSYRELNRVPYPEKGTRHLNLSYNNIGDLFDNETLTNLDVDWTMSNLISLDLSHNDLRDIGRRYFKDLKKLSMLNLMNNRIEKIGIEAFYGLWNLKSLYLKGNRIRLIEAGAFRGVDGLTQLDLSGQDIKVLNKAVFQDLKNLVKLNLSRNHLTLINDGIFYRLHQLEQLDISNNIYGIAVESQAFYGLPSLKHLITSEFRICCLADFIATCEPRAGAFSSCDDLMSNIALRIMIWVIGVSALFGNLMVLIWRLRQRRESKVHSFLITNLALGDLAMGIYLIIIAIADQIYRGVYATHETTWRHSVVCQMCGFLSTFSSELSVLTLTLITIDRLICIIFPFTIKRMGMKQARIVMASLWVAVLLLSALPLTDVAYFSEFYSRSSVCLAFQLTQEKPLGWEYSVFVFLALNLVAFVIIFASYLWMFVVAKKTQSAVRAPEVKKDNAMARRMTLIVMTDFFCWVPICLLGIASLGGVNIPPQVYAWIAVFVLPLNSGINPILYTLSTAPFVKNIQKRASTFRNSLMNTTITTKNTCSYIDESTNAGQRSRTMMLNETRYKPVEASIRRTSRTKSRINGGPTGHSLLDDTETDDNIQMEVTL